MTTQQQLSRGRWAVAAVFAAQRATLAAKMQADH
jgi:hypothetical protein